MDSERSEITKVLNLGKHVHLSLYVSVSVNCTFICTLKVYVVWVVPECNSTPGVQRSASETRYMRNSIWFDIEPHHLSRPHSLGSAALCTQYVSHKLILFTFSYELSMYELLLCPAYGGTVKSC